MGWHKKVLREANRLVYPTQEMDHYILALRTDTVLPSPDTDTATHVVLRLTTAVIAVRTLIHPIDEEVEWEDLPPMGMPREMEIYTSELSLLEVVRLVIKD